MPMFTSLLFFFIALALLPLALRNSGARELRRQGARDVERITIGAQICEATARDAFEVELDHSRESIALLDTLITQGWSNETPASTSENYDPIYIMGAYVGDVFVRAGNAEWRWENGEAFLYVSKWKRKISPFDLIQRKFRDPLHIHLNEETVMWLMPLTPLENDASTKY
jgi:hypothetical protein